MGSFPAAEKAARAVHRDLAYAGRSDRNRLDLYLPPGGATAPPVVVMIHGGAFRTGDKAGPDGTGPWGAHALLSAGFAVAAMNYRLSGEACWPAQHDDIRDAFAFVRANGMAYGYDAGRVAVFGPSAGGHLAAMAGLALADDPATRLCACVLWYPPIDFAHMDADLAASGVAPATGRHGAAGSAESDLIGAVVDDNPDLARAASPLSRLDALDPATPLPDVLIVHGALDPIIGRLQSARLAFALAARPVSARIEFVVLPRGTHGGGEFTEPATRDRAIAFLKHSFGGT